VRGGEGDELAGGDDFGLFPEWREVAGVAGDEVIGAGGVGTFQEGVVVRGRRRPGCGGKRRAFTGRLRFIGKK
jgi:hypothetical protein